MPFLPLKHRLSVLLSKAFRLTEFRHSQHLPADTVRAGDVQCGLVERVVREWRRRQCRARGRRDVMFRRSGDRRAGQRLRDVRGCNLRTAEPERHRDHPARVRHLRRCRRRRSRGHHRRTAHPVDRGCSHGAQKSDPASAFGARVGRGDGGSGGRDVGGGQATPVPGLRRRSPQGHHDPARRDRPEATLRCCVRAGRHC